MSKLEIGLFIAYSAAFLAVGIGIGSCMKNNKQDTRLDGLENRMGWAEKAQENFVKDEDLGEVWETINDLDPNIPSAQGCEFVCPDEPDPLGGYTFGLEECLYDCKIDYKRYDVTPMQYKGCKKKCKNQYGEE